MSTLLILRMISVYEPYRNPQNFDARTGEADRPCVVGGARVIGQITFDRPILGLIGGTSLLNRTDELLGNPLGDYGSTRRGIEPTRPDDLPDSGRDHVTLSRDRRTLSLDLSASSAVDQIRVLVSEQPLGDLSRLGIETTSEN